MSIMSQGVLLFISRLMLPFTMIQLHNITVAYQDTIVLDSICLTITQPDSLLIQAPSGSGKSTLLRIICDLQKPTTGIRYAPAMTHSDIVYVSAHAYIFDQICAFEAACIGSLIKHRTINKAYADYLFNELELNPIRDRIVRYLSAGQKQRIALIHALLCQPSVLCIDEPTAHLDTKLAHKCSVLLKEYALNHTVIVASHQADLFDWMHRSYLLSSGVLHEKK